MSRIVVVLAPLTLIHCTGNYQTDVQWRLPLALQVAFVIITLSSIIFLPESPRWLVNSDQISKARDVLWRLDGNKDEKARAVSVEVQLNEIIEAVELERKSGGASFKTCFSMGDQRVFQR